jgi:small conductance mechanosensitive channel
MPAKLRASLLALLLLCTPLLPVAAQPVGIPGASTPTATAEPPPDVDAAMQSLLEVLKNPAARDELVRRLENLQPQGTPEPEAETDLGVLGGMIHAVEHRAALVANVLMASARALTTLPEAGTWLSSRAGDERTVDIATEVARRLALMFAIGSLLALGGHLALRHYRRRLIASPGSGPAARAVLAIFRVIVELVPLLLFVAAIAVASALVEFSFMARLVVRQMMLAIVLARAVAAIRRALLYPLDAPGRLLPVSDALARELNGWGRWVGNLGIYGYFALRIGLLIGLPWELFGLLEHLLFMAVTIMVVALILRLRQPVRDWLMVFRARVGKQGWARVLPMRRLAESWHVIAIGLVIVHFLVWALHIPNGFRTLLISTVATVGIVLAARLGVMLLSRGEAQPAPTADVESDQALEAPAEVTSPGIGWRRLLRVGIDSLTVLVLLVIWLPGLRQWLQGPAGADLLAALLRIALVAAVVAAIWFIGRRRLEGYVAATDADGNPRHSRRARTVAVIANNALLVVLLTFAGFFALSQLGVNTAPLLAGAGVVGIAVGFGAQTLVKDVITGLFILLGDTVRVGDVVDLGVKSGGVEAMSLRTITLRDYNGALHSVPYSAITVITNMTKDYAYSTFDTAIDYDEDPDRIMDILRDIDRQLRREWPFRRIMLEPIQIDGLDQFGPAGILIKSRVKVRAGEQWRVSREFNRRLKKRLDELGIQVPFPRQTIAVAERDGTGHPLRHEPGRHELREDGPVPEIARPASGTGG